MRVVNSGLRGAVIRGKQCSLFSRNLMRRISQLFIGALALATPFFFSGEAAAASLAACGNIHVEADAECKVEVEGGCTAQCEPVNFQAACAADLSVECAGPCNVSASAECTGSCQGSCEADCEVKPAEFNCTASCQADCSADCSGRCAADSNSAECEASCKGSCTADCDASCKVTPAEADCTAKCEASCSGSCHAEANVDCQIECQASGYADCTANLTGGCKAQCSKPEGAMFCDGQYVDAGNQLEECIAALKAIFNIEASGSASCEGNSCMAEGQVSCNCSADGGDMNLAGAMGLGFVVLVATRRRRRS
jgi:MYXO-CTERM domain-containing protein